MIPSTELCQVLFARFKDEFNVAALFKTVVPDTYKLDDGDVVPIPTLPFWRTVNKLVKAEPAPPPTGRWLIVKLDVYGMRVYPALPEGLFPPLFKFILTPQYEYRLLSPAKTL